MACSAAASSAKRTNPNPRLRPVSRSFTTICARQRQVCYALQTAAHTASSTAPNSTNLSSSSSSSSSSGASSNPSSSSSSSSQSSQGYTIYDLQNTNYTLFTQEVYTSNWTLSGLRTAGFNTTMCTGMPILGGYVVLSGSGSGWFEKTYYNLPSHNQVNNGHYRT